MQVQKIQKNNYNANFQGKMIIKNYKNGNLTNLELPYDKDVSLFKSIKNCFSNYSQVMYNLQHTEYTLHQYLRSPIKPYIDELKKIGINLPKSNNKEWRIDFNYKFDGMHQNIDYSINAGKYKIVHKLRSWYKIA